MKLKEVILITGVIITIIIWGFYIVTLIYLCLEIKMRRKVKRELREQKYLINDKR